MYMSARQSYEVMYQLVPTHGVLQMNLYNSASAGLLLEKSSLCKLGYFHFIL